VRLKKFSTVTYRGCTCGHNAGENQLSNIEDYNHSLRVNENFKLVFCTGPVCHSCSRRGSAQPSVVFTVWVPVPVITVCSGILLVTVPRDDHSSHSRSRQSRGTEGVRRCRVPRDFYRSQSRAELYLESLSRRAISWAHGVDNR